MPKVSVIILTKNRAQILRKALASVDRQTFRDFEIVVVDDGSTDETQAVLKEFTSVGVSSIGGGKLNILTIVHNTSYGITKSRQEALEKASGELVAFLDDDDEWVDAEKLAKQVRWFEENPKGVLCGGAVKISNIKYQISKFRPETDSQIRNTMLLRNNFFTSTVIVRRQAALDVGGFIIDTIDLVEDYDLWLRMGLKGEMHNFREVFTNYTQSSYNKDKFKQFLAKQLTLIGRHKAEYPGYWLSMVILKIRLLS